MFYSSYQNHILYYCHQEANGRLGLVETTGRHLSTGVNWWLCPLCLVSHTSMYLNGQTERSSYGIHAIGSYGRFLQEGGME